MIVGDAPHARVYVPEPLRAGVAVSQRERVFVGADDGEQVFEGTVRIIRSEPTFTPYYALIGDDAARLSYLAEIQLDEDAGALPAGLRSEEHTSELQSLMRISYAVFCLKKKKTKNRTPTTNVHTHNINYYLKQYKQNHRQ